MEPKSLQAGPDYAEGLINKMRTIIRRNPHQGDAAHTTPQPATLGQRLKRSGHHSPPSSTVSSLVADRRPFFIVIALLAALAVSMLFLLPGGLLQAQDAGPIEYPENGTGAVATFTAVDPEGDSIMWSLTGADAEDLTIEGGVLEFVLTPDYENAADTGADNTYEVTVSASDGTLASTEDLEIQVTNMEEPGVVMLPTLQPQVGVPMTATLTDPDGVTDGTVAWAWYQGSNVIAGGANATYTPLAGDVGSFLTAKATYMDGEDTEADKMSEAVSMYAVRAAPDSNIIPTFPDTDLTTPGVQTAPRSVAENTPAGRNIGAPVVATDPGDVLTYSIDTTADATFDIDRASGQLKTQASLDHEGTPSYTVTVTATDPFGSPAEVEVTVMVTDVDEDPSITSTTDAVRSLTSLEATIAAPLTLATALATYAATDPEEETVTLDLSGPDAGDFEIDAGALTFMEQPDYEAAADANEDNVYEITVVASDPANNSDELTVLVTVTNVGEAGSISFSAEQPRVDVALMATLADPDGIVDDIEWQWENGGTEIEDATSDTYTPTLEDEGDTLTVIATYRDGELAVDAEPIALESAATAAVARDTDNKAPRFLDADGEVVTSVERTVAENTAAATAIGDVVTATDPSGANADVQDTLTYTLGGADAASFSIARATAQLSTKAALNHEDKSSHTVTVTATDPSGLSATVTVTIMVTDGNEDPELDGEAPAEYAENGTSRVTTFTAVDPEGEDIVWTLGGADAEDFTIGGGVLEFMSTPDFEDEADANSDNTYVITVNASDGTNTATEEVEIAVTNVEEPGVVMLSTLQPQVGVTVTATLTDPDGVTDGTVTWAWYRDSNVISGASSATYPPVAGDVGSILKAKATYMDDEDDEADKMAEASSSRSVRRVPTQGNTDPMFPDTDLTTPGVQTAQTRSVAENTPAGRNIGAPVVATDPDDVLTYSIDTTADATFDIDRGSGQLKTQALLNHEGTPSYAVTVTATDPWGIDVDAVVTVTVTDVDEDPSITSTTDAVRSLTSLEATIAAPLTLTTALATYVATDPEEETVTWDLSGPDAGDFEIDAGALTFMEQPDYEAAADANEDNVYEITVVASDPANNSDELTVRVTVSNEEEPGSISFSAEQPRVDVALMATLADPDGIVDDIEWQWENGGTEIEDATSDTYTPTLEDEGDTLTVIATYRDGELAVDAEPIALESAATAAVARDTDNKAPRFLDADGEVVTSVERTVAENTAAATAIGDVVTATDPSGANADVQDTLTYTLGGADAASFSIARATAQLSTKAALNYEDKSSYTVTVTATDPSGASATVTVTIMVTDEPEAPEIMRGGLAARGPANVTYSEDRSDAVASYTAAGPDADMVSWSLSGDDADDFMLSSSGVLTFNSAPDYEDPVDADTDNVYQVTVEANDGTNDATRDVTVTVTDVDEPGNDAPTFATETDTKEVAENTAASTAIGAPVAATDANNDELTYTLSGTDAGSFAIDASTGQLMTLAALDFEMKTSYTVTVTATDPYDDTAMITVTITVTNVDEPGMVTLTSTRSVVGIAITATLEDPDGGETDVTWQWDGSSDEATYTDIDAATMAEYTPADTDAGNRLRATASYTDPEGSGKSAMSEPTDETIVNAAPMFATETDTREVAENTAASTAIGAPVAATDANNDELTYTLSGTDAGSFAIDASTGQLMTLAALDFEMKTSYTVTVTATDPYDDTAMITVTITVTDVTLSEAGEAYDENHDEQIDRSEVNTAIRAYFAVGSTVTKADVVEVIRVHFASPS